MRTRIIVAILLVFGLGAAWMDPPDITSVQDAWRADACLDSGGSFDYRRRACDYFMNHPSD